MSRGWDENEKPLGLEGWSTTVLSYVNMLIKAMEYQNKNQIGKILGASLGLLDGIALSYTAN